MFRYFYEHIAPLAEQLDKLTQPRPRRIRVTYSADTHQTAMLSYKGTTRIVFLEPGSCDLLAFNYERDVAAEQAFDPLDWSF